MNYKEIILYQSGDLPKRIKVKLEYKTIWLYQDQLSSLFPSDQSVIFRHIRNVFKKVELNEDSNMQKMYIANSDKPVAYYNLKIIISDGYHVKSEQDTQFRICATKVLRNYLLKSYTLNQRMNRIENTMEPLTNKVNEIDFQIQSNDLPQKDVFFDGQIFNSYSIVSNIITNAKKIIILIDNYINATTVTLLAKKKKNEKTLLPTKSINWALQLDIEKAKEQYGDFKIISFNQSYDRFLIIIKKELYHIGATLKDLGKKWFIFSRMNAMAEELLL